jgi:hypothetical protein
MEKIAQHAIAALIRWQLRDSLRSEPTKLQATVFMRQTALSPSARIQQGCSLAVRRKVFHQPPGFGRCLQIGRNNCAGKSLHASIRLNASPI